MPILLMILAIVAVIFVVWVYAHAHPLPRTSVIAFTGTMGSGKTLSAVSLLKREYRRRRLVYRFQRVVWLATFKRKPEPVPPSVYSNIPLRVRYRSRGRSEYARPVTKALLVCEDHFPENALVLLDEISTIADQYDFDEPLVMERLGRLMKFYRHWTGGKIFITEQAVSCITKPIRDKMGGCLQCEGVTRLLLVLPFVKVAVRPLVLVDSEVANAHDVVDHDDIPYIVYYCPPKILQSRKKASYDSRCYKPIYHNGAVKEPDFEPDKLDTRYLADVTSDNERKRAYKASRQAEKEWIYK